MAISWGAWEYSGGNGMRVGVEVTWTSATGGAIGHGTVTAKATVDYYTENQFTYGDGQRLTLSGAIDDVIDFQNNAGGTPVLRATRTRTRDYGANEYGSSPVTWTFTVALSGAFNGVTPSKSLSSALPGRPYDVPAAPTNISLARISDASTKVTWTNNATSGEPWNAVKVDRERNDGSWFNVANTGGAATSYTDGTASDNKYRFRARSENSIGNSSYVTSGYIYTTPDTPTSCVRSGTSTQVIDWVNNVAYSEYNTEVWRSVNGAAYTLVATKLTGVTQHSESAPAGTVKYKVRAKTTSGSQGTLYSSYSNETSTYAGSTAPPNAPTTLDPADELIAAGSINNFTWVFDPSIVGDTQTKYQVRYRVTGSSTWTTNSEVVSTVAQWASPASTFTIGNVYEWQVRTWGAHATAGPYSASSVFLASTTAAGSTLRPVAWDILQGDMKVVVGSTFVREEVVAKVASSAANGVTVLTNVLQVAYPAISGAEYEATVVVAISNSSAGSNTDVALKEDTASSGTGGTMMADQITTHATATRRYPAPLHATWIAASTATRYVKVTIDPSTGTSTFQGSLSPSYLVIRRIG